MLRSMARALVVLVLSLAAVTASAADLRKVKPLAKPIQTTAADVVLAGHGTYEYKGETVVPAGAELWVLVPPGGALAEATGQALWGGKKITKLAVVSKKTKEASPVQPVVYKAGAKAPNYTLHPYARIAPSAGGPKVVQADGKSTTLDALWAQVKPHLQAGKTTRVFWAACTKLEDATEARPRVDYQ